MEDFNSLNDILNKLSGLINNEDKDDLFSINKNNGENNIDFNYELKWLMKQDNRHALFEENPFCFLSLNVDETMIPFFPVCSQNAEISPKMIEFSLKLASKLINNKRVNQKYLQLTTEKLNLLKRKHSK